MSQSVYLTKTELKTHIYDEVLNIITREDDDIVDEQIHAAIGEAKSYLEKYDLDALFGIEAAGEDAAVEPTFADTNLKQKVKALAIWNIISLANTSVDLAVMNTRKDDAISWLRKVQANIAVPAGWPLKDYTDATTINGAQVTGFNNDKKTNRF